jgi:hypothetical protein
MDGNFDSLAKDLRYSLRTDAQPRRAEIFSGVAGFIGASFNISGWEGSECVSGGAGRWLVPLLPNGRSVGFRLSTATQTQPV